jgi:hypothetical protein
MGRVLGRDVQLLVRAPLTATDPLGLRLCRHGEVEPLGLRQKPPPATVGVASPR